ncbi:hypothetical protein ACIQUM_07505 [Amycolatopsis azurea]|uniref:hypothetical protein n=1 Tax=Amycolatopsis azurea TaxID=36819 RepID=UPI0037F89013
MSFRSFFESDEQERERLAEAPEGSSCHSLSQLPVTIREWPQDLIVALPWAALGRSDHHVAVVPIRFSPASRPEGPGEGLLRKRYTGAWECVVVASDHPQYPIGGHRLSIPAAEIARGTKISI